MKGKGETLLCPETSERVRERRRLFLSIGACYIPKLEINFAALVIRSPGRADLKQCVQAGTHKFCKAFVSGGVVVTGVRICC